MIYCNGKLTGLKNLKNLTIYNVVRNGTLGIYNGPVGGQIMSIFPKRRVFLKVDLLSFSKLFEKRFYDLPGLRYGQLKLIDYSKQVPIFMHGT